MQKRFCKFCSYFKITQIFLTQIQEYILYCNIVGIDTEKSHKHSTFTIVLKLDIHCYDKFVITVVKKC